MANRQALYKIQIEKTSKYDYSAIIVDASTDKPESTTVLAKGMPELMAKLLVALVLRDKRLGDEQPVPEKENGDGNGAGEVAIIFHPNRTIVKPPQP